MGARCIVPLKGATPGADRPCALFPLSPEKEDRLEESCRLAISAARLTQRVPWLCVPLLREVCLFDCCSNLRLTPLTRKVNAFRGLGGSWGDTQPSSNQNGPPPQF